VTRPTRRVLHGAGRRTSDTRAIRTGAARDGCNRRVMLTVSQLADSVKGRVIAPDDPGYDQARAVFSGEIDRRPAMIVRAVDATDVACVIALARDTGMELAIRSGGHSAAGHGVSDGGIVLDLRDMRSVTIDVERRTARADAGLTAGEYTVAAAAHGLGTGFGDAGSVGIGGITLSGGVGYLARKHGLTIDHLLAAEIVTADGELRRVDAETHPDLFWAIRGGGGNFGVVTRFEFRLHEVESFVGGVLMLPATPDVIASFVAEAQAAPDELSTIANVMPAPPMPFVPEEHHGRLVVLGTLAYAGAVEDGERAVAPFRALAEPIVDMVAPMPYPQIYPPEEEGYRPMGVVRTMFVDGVDGRLAETILDGLRAATAPMSVTQLRVLGGAVARVPADATAFAHRARRIMLNVGALYARPEERPVHESWVLGLAERLAPGSDGAYVGFLGDEGEDRVRAAYPGSTWRRLAEVKGRYDPENLFRLNQNVPPAVG
jgi:FAD/FMN-containing dehydrogenase